MKPLSTGIATLFFAALLSSIVSAQTLAPTPIQSAEVTQLQALAKKIDEQNAKIDILSQQILKLEQQIANMRPGVMIGEGAASPATSPTSGESPRTANENTHIVQRGETLTSIAKMHKVTVDELQKYNHIENDRKLQIGQTILIPTPATPAPSASSSGQQ